MRVLAAAGTAAVLLAGCVSTIEPVSMGGGARLISLFTDACSKSAFTPFPERRF
jgi:hypothetical protein